MLARPQEDSALDLSLLPQLLGYASMVCWSLEFDFPLSISTAVGQPYLQLPLRWMAQALPLTLVGMDNQEMQTPPEQEPCLFWSPPNPLCLGTGIIFLQNE